MLPPVSGDDLLRFSSRSPAGWRERILKTSLPRCRTRRSIAAARLCWRAFQNFRTYGHYGSHLARHWPV